MENLINDYLTKNRFENFEGKLIMITFGKHGASIKKG